MRVAQRAHPRRSATRQAEHALGDDVALNLTRPAGDRARERVEVLLRPRAVAVVEERVATEVERFGTDRVDDREDRTLERFAAVQLQQRVFRRGAAVTELRK